MAVCFLLAGCASFDDRMDKDTIFSCVEENRELILSCVEKQDLSPLAEILPTENIHIGEDCVDFDCGGAGFGPATAYRGFFYAEEENLYGAWCAPPSGQSLTPQGKGFFWQEAKGDNTYYVEKICDGFFYYEASF